LIVDDDNDVRSTICEILEDNQYHAIGAINGQDALERLRTTSPKPCVILLDLMMPVMDGWQFLNAHASEAELRSIPVVVVSAHPSARGTAGEMNAECLRKPFLFISLLETVERYCNPLPGATRSPS
jgi:CheY-like chemotaxis protein